MKSTSSGPTPVNSASLPLRILIADDEQPARVRLREVLADCAHAIPFEVVGEAATGLEAFVAVQKQPVDVLLLDIRMPDMDGLECATHLNRLEAPPAIIFCTAYDAYACQAFEQNAVDYLLKPVRAERLLRALHRAQRLNSTALDALRASDAAIRTHLAVPERGRVKLVPVADILYLKAEQKYVSVRTVDAEYLIEDPLTRLEAEFGDTFVRVHRSCLVARARIRRLGKASTAEDSHVLELDGLAEPIGVSRRQYTQLRDLLGLD